VKLHSIFQKIVLFLISKKKKVEKNSRKTQTGKLLSVVICCVRFPSCHALWQKSEFEIALLRFELERAEFGRQIALYFLLSSGSFGSSCSIFQELIICKGRLSIFLFLKKRNCSTSFSYPREGRNQ
jgi:hypothetical protein